MDRKEGSVFGLAVVPPPFVPAPVDMGLSTTMGRHLTHNEQRAVAEWHLEMLVIEAQAAKTEFAVSKIGEINQHASSVFEMSVAYVFSLKEQAHGQPYQAYSDEFSTRLLAAMGRHMLGAVEVGGTIIGKEVHRALYPEPEPPEPRSLWRRVIG